MNGNQTLPEGFEEEMLGHNAIAAGFQGQRQWTDFYPNGDFAEAILNTSFDWNEAREPYILATENDVLNGISMLFMKLLTNRAQMFADVRSYWSGASIKRVTGYEIEGKAKDSDGVIHLINSGACCLDAIGEAKDENGAISYGHIGADLITLCSILRIPVCMHNVPAEDIFRPKVWDAYGMDKEAADYRACAAYGPMYK